MKLKSLSVIDSDVPHLDGNHYKIQECSGWTFQMKNQLSFVLEILLPTSIREKYLIFTFLTSSTLLIFTLTILFQSNPLLMTAFACVFSSVIAAISIEYLSQITPKTVSLINRRKFYSLFSCDNEANQSVLVVLPEFKVEKLQGEDYADENSINIINKTATGIEAKRVTLQDISRRPYNAATEVDIRAFSSIVLAFSRIGLSVPELAWDEQIWDNEIREIDQDYIDFKSYIMIGLFSNSIVNEYSIVRDDFTRFFSIRRSDNRRIQQVINTLRYAHFDDDGRLAPEEDWEEKEVRWLTEESKTVDDYDYGLFGKFFIQEKALITCGGTTEFGTRYLTEYIADHCGEIYSELTTEKGCELDSRDPFVVIFEIPISEQILISENISEKIRSIGVCIQPQNK